MIRIPTDSPDIGVRADAVILKYAPNLSRNAIQLLIADGKISLENSSAVLKKNHRVTPGDVFLLNIPEPVPISVSPEPIPLNIVFEDDDLLVINKPKGLVVHPAPGHYNGTLVNALLWHCADSLSGIGGELRPGIVHRLDKDTSGLLIAAKNDYAHRILSSQLSNRSLSRVYETVVRGCPHDDSGSIDAPIGRSPSDRKKMAVTDRASRNARTSYELIERFNGYSHLRCSLHTGRTHQIRVHLAYIGHPVIGDSLYGTKRKEFGLDGQCLHARSLSFIHPRTNCNMDFESELPDYFQAVLQKLRKV